jgi:hypothetical protein
MALRQKAGSDYFFDSLLFVERQSLSTNLHPESTKPDIWRVKFPIPIEPRNFQWKKRSINAFCGREMVEKTSKTPTKNQVSYGYGTSLKFKNYIQMQTDDKQ